MQYETILEANVIGMAINTLDHGEPLPDCVGGIQADDFTDPLFARAWPIITQTKSVQRMATQKINQQLGGAAVDFIKLDSAVADSSSYFNLGVFATDLIKQARERKAKARLVVASRLVSSATDVFGAASELHTALRDIEKTTTQPGTSMMDLARQWASGGNREQKPEVAATGIAMLDQFLGGGVSRAGLHVFAGSPGAGKSALALQVALRFCLNDPRQVHVFSCEMTGPEQFQRLRKQAERQHIEPGDLARRGMRFHEPPLVIDAIEGIVRATHNPGLVVVDYIQRVRATRVKKSDNREREVAEVSERLKALAVTCRVPIIACAQLNRQSQQQNRAPLLSDLRESGALEQDADTVIAIHRQGDGEQLLSRDGELCLLKNRNGECVTVPVIFHGASYEFFQRSTNGAY
jgi:replicative DNA helicase